MVRRAKGHRASACWNAAQGSLVSTYQTRIADYSSADRAVGDAALSAYGELYGRVQRRLFAAVSAGRSAPAMKSEYLQRYGIPARMFNAVRVSPDGKVASVREQQKLRLDDLQRRIARAERQIGDAVERGSLGQVHQKKRRLVNLRHGLACTGNRPARDGWSVLRVAAACGGCASPRRCTPPHEGSPLA